MEEPESLPWEICFRVYRRRGHARMMRATIKEAEVSRSHSSEESFVMKEERRAESLKRVSFFLEVVKANEEN